MTDFNTFRAAINKHQGVTPFVGRLLALDPGETTGVATFEVTEQQIASLTYTDQIQTWPMDQAVKNLTSLFASHKPTIIVYERYAVYGWKTTDHAWSDIPAVQVIGCLQTLAIQLNDPHPLLHQQTAQMAKNFCTDNRLREWNMYIRGKRHSRDAIRHGTYYLLFGGPKK